MQARHALVTCRVRSRDRARGRSQARSLLEQPSAPPPPCGQRRWGASLPLEPNRRLSCRWRFALAVTLVAPVHVARSRRPARLPRAWRRPLWAPPACGMLDRPCARLPPCVSPETPAPRSIMRPAVCAQLLHHARPAHAMRVCSRQHMRAFQLCKPHTLHTRANIAWVRATSYACETGRWQQPALSTAFVLSACFCLSRFSDTYATVT